VESGVRNPFRRENPASEVVRRQRLGVVQRTERLSPHMTRVVFGGPDMADFAVEHSDSYVKLVFPVEGVTYDEPFDVAAIREHRPRTEWPVQRTYSIRSIDDGEVTIDFVVHGDEGFAGPWAASAAPGDTLWIMGPGGAYTPSEDAPWHLLVGDASALPAISASLEVVPAGVPVVAVVEVHDAAEELPVTSPGDLRLHWVHRAAPDPEALLQFLAGLDLPAGTPQAFLHGEADTVRAVRRWARTDLGVTKEFLSASGYWRRGRTEEGWRSEKRDWNSATETDDATAGV
jgi:NADPH-dependent ferric siderophore reductase